MRGASYESPPDEAFDCACANGIGTAGEVAVTDQIVNRFDLLLGESAAHDGLTHYFAFYYAFSIVILNKTNDILIVF